MDESSQRTLATQLQSGLHRIGDGCPDVQFIEVNDFEVNAAIHELARASDSARVVLFPMVHVAEVSFYEDIAARAAECDAVIFEGVRSPIAAIAS